MSSERESQQRLVQPLCESRLRTAMNLVLLTHNGLSVCYFRRKLQTSRKGWETSKLQGKCPLMYDAMPQLLSSCQRNVLSSNIFKELVSSENTGLGSTGQKNQDKCKPWKVKPWKQVLPNLQPMSSDLMSESESPGVYMWWDSHVLGVWHLLNTLLFFYRSTQQSLLPRDCQRIPKERK